MKNGFFLLVTLLCYASHAQQQPRKPTIAVLNLKNAANVSKGEADIISDRLRIELFKTGNVEVMEREQMQTVLEEQGFQASGACSDEGCMVEMGQLLGVQFLITGSIGKLGNLYLLNFRSIDVKTGKINKVVSEDINGYIEEVVGRLSDIAWDLTSKAKKKKSKPVTQPVEHVKKTAKPEEPIDTSSEPLPDCDETVFLQALDLSQFPIPIHDDSFDEITGDIKDAIESACEEEIDDDIDVEVVTPRQIARFSSSCKSGLVRMKFISYSTRPDDDETIGKVKACFFFYDTPSSQRPSFKITIEKEGGSHIGEQKILMDAFDDLADELEDELADNDYIDNLDPDKD